MSGTAKKYWSIASVLTCYIKWYKNYIIGSYSQYMEQLLINKSLNKWNRHKARTAEFTETKKADIEEYCKKGEIIAVL